MARRWTSIALLIWVVSAPGCREEPAAGGGRALLDEAARLSERGLDIEAARLVRDALAGLPEKERGPAHAAVARYYHRADLYIAALEHAEKALHLGDARPDVAYIQGDSLRELRRIDEAEAILEDLLAREPGHLRGALALASLRLRAGDAAAAIPLLEKFLEGAPEDEPRLIEAHIEYGRALRRAGRLPEAADRFIGVLERRPLEATACSELATTLFRLRRRDEARLVESIYTSLARSSFEEHVAEELRKAGISSYALTQKAINLTAQKRFLEAYGSYRQALEVDRREPRIRLYFSEFCLRFLRLEEAAERLDEALSLGMAPSSGLHWMRCRIHLENGESAEALAAARRAEAALSREGDQGGHEKGQAPAFSLSLARARSALETGALDDARRAATRALGLDPGRWEPHYWLGRTDLAEEKPAAALARFAEASRLGGTQFVDLIYWNGLALERNGHPKEAYSQLEQILRGHPAKLEVYAPLLRLAADAPDRRPDLEKRRDRARELEASRVSIEKRADEKAMAAAGADYFELGKLLFRLRDPKAFDFLLLAADLEPGIPEILRLLLGGLERREDVFFRLHILRRLHRLEPDDPVVAANLAELYLGFGVRQDEASRLAGLVHALRPSARSYRLEARAALAEGDRETAVEWLERGLAAHPGDADLEAALSRARGN